MNGKGWLVLAAAATALLAGGAGLHAKKTGEPAAPPTSQPQPAARAASLADPRGAFYVGTVGDQPVQMSLLKTAKGLAGAYYFEKTGLPRELLGSFVDDEGRAVLRERSSSKVAGRYVVRPGNQFEGTLALSYWRFKGKWIGDDQTQLPFFLTKVATYVAARDNDFHCTASSLYPVLSGETAAIREINRTIRDQMDRRRAEFLKEQAKDCRDLAKDQILPTGIFEHSDICTVRCVHPGLVSLLREMSEYTGGAHENTTYTSLNWRIENGKAIPFELEHLFREKSDWVKKIAQEACLDLKRQKATWYMDGDPKKTEVPLETLQVFYLTPQGITFVFDPYAAGSYAEGAYRVMLPWSKLKDVVDPDGPVKYLLVPAPTSQPGQ